MDRLGWRAGLRSALRDVTPPFLRRLARRLTPADPVPRQRREWTQPPAGPLRGRHLLLVGGSEAPAWQRRMALGVFDEEMFRYLESRETDGAVFFDVGAHLGYHTLAFAAIGGPRTRVVAFEPNPANLARLRTNLEANEELAPRVTVLDLALADCDGVTALFTNEDVDGGGSSMGFIGSATPPAPSGVYAGAGFRPQQVSTARLDTLLEAGGLPVPDFLKIDVEGAEDLVLHGAVGLLTARKPCVLLEVHSAVAMFRVGRQLESAGYEVELLRAERDGRVQVAARPRGA